MTYIVVHVGGAQQIDGVVVRELGAVDVGAVVLDVAAVVDGVLGVHEADAHDPVPRLLGPVGVRLVARVAREARAEVEEAAVCDAWVVSQRRLRWCARECSLFL